MNMSTNNSDHEKIWELIKSAHSALLVTVKQDGRLDSRPMGCLQRHLDGALYFLSFRHSLKLSQIRNNPHVLVSYAKPSEYEYVSISGTARVIDDRHKLNELWTEGLRVWFPKGPDDPEIALLAVDIEEAMYWTNSASAVTYAWANLISKLRFSRAVHCANCCGAAISTVGTAFAWYASLLCYERIIRPRRTAR